MYVGDGLRCSDMVMDFWVSRVHEAASFLLIYKLPSPFFYDAESCRVAIDDFIVACLRTTASMNFLRLLFLLYSSIDL